MPNLGPQYDLAARLAALEDTVRRMQANPLAQAFSMTQSDGSVGMALGQDPQTGSGRWIVYQGTTTGRDPNTAQHPLLMYLGELVDGTGAWVDSGMIFFRPDGSESLVVGAGGAGILDRSGDQVFTTDETSGEGIAEPWIPLPLPVSTNLADWPATTNTTWTTIADQVFRAQHVKVWVETQTICDSGTTGDVQVLLNGPSGVLATGTSHAIDGTAFVTTSDVLTLPAGFWGQPYTVTVQAQVTSGTGKLYCRPITAYGRQT